MPFALAVCRGGQVMFVVPDPGLASRPGPSVAVVLARHGAGVIFPQHRDGHAAGGLVGKFRVWGGSASACTGHDERHAGVHHPTRVYWSSSSIRWATRGSSLSQLVRRQWLQKSSCPPRGSRQDRLRMTTTRAWEWQASQRVVALRIALTYHHPSGQKKRPEPCGPDLALGTVLPSE